MNKITLGLATSLIVIAISACDSATPEEKEQRTCEDGILAYLYAQDFIKQRLKAPSTAEFQSFRGVNHTYQGECTHRITGSVDAQNSFGAQIRNRFDVTVRYSKDNKTYYLDKISLN